MTAAAVPSAPVFLKLGGSLITDKHAPQTARPDTILRLAEEIAAVFNQPPGCRLVLGHGSGSYGHIPARHYGTRLGVHTAEEWRGFIEVWRAAAALNRLMIDVFSDAGLPVIPFPPSACVTAEDGQVLIWELQPLESALAAGLIPVVYGDVVFDRVRGGTILSTEDLFAHLARALKPKRVLLAGLDPGVCSDFPECREVIPDIVPETFAEMQGQLGGSNAPDVTGGMAAKVAQALSMAAESPGLEVIIFSGETPGAVVGEMRGEPIARRTRVHAAVTGRRA